MDDVKVRNDLFVPLSQNNPFIIIVVPDVLIRFLYMPSTASPNV